MKGDVSIWNQRDPNSNISLHILHNFQLMNLIVDCKVKVAVTVDDMIYWTVSECCGL